MVVGILLALSACWLWGLEFIFPKILSEFSSIELLVARYSFYALLAAIVLWHQDKLRYKVMPPSYWRVAFIVAICGYSGYYFFIMQGVRLAGVPTTSLMISTLPVVTAFIINLLQREFPMRIFAISFVLIGLGMVLVNLNHGSSAGLHVETYTEGLVCGMVALVLGATGAVVNARFLKRHPELRSSTWTAMVGVVTFLTLPPLAFYSLFQADQLGIQFGLLHASGTDILFFLGVSCVIGIGVSWFGTLFWSKACQKAPISLLTQLFVFETISAITYNFFYELTLPVAMRTNITWTMGCGMILILGGVMLSLYQVKIRSQKDKVQGTDGSGQKEDLQKKVEHVA